MFTALCKVSCIPLLVATFAVAVHNLHKHSASLGWLTLMLFVLFIASISGWLFHDVRIWPVSLRTIISIMLMIGYSVSVFCGIANTEYLALWVTIIILLVHVIVPNKAIPIRF